jgi:ubiquinone/menaquinone biosynthesis C-methylase UbiE
MEARTALPAPTISYDERAEAYAKHRKVHPGVVAELIDSGLLTATTRVLDVGCGTGNYAAVLSEATGCRMSGIEPSTQMLDRARDAAPWEALVQGAAESLPFADDAFDLVMSTDAIHHIGDRDAYFREAARVLHPGGQIVTVTDSHDDIPRRRPLASHFPETITVELDRYPPVPQILNEMGRAGFTSTCLRQVSHDYELRDIQAYRDRAFSSLLLIDERAFARGIARLEADLVQGPIPCRSLYTMIWGTKPGV